MLQATSSQMLAGACSQLRQNDHDSHELAALLFRLALEGTHPTGYFDHQLPSRVAYIAVLGSTHGSGGDGLKEMLPSLLSLLDSNDGVSQAVVGLVAEIAATEPSVSLDAIFQAMDAKAKGGDVSSGSAFRRNSLMVISEVLQLGIGMLTHGTTSHDQAVPQGAGAGAGAGADHQTPVSASADAGMEVASRKAGAELVEHLVAQLFKRIHDSELFVRCQVCTPSWFGCLAMSDSMLQAARLFRLVDCDLVIPKLCRLVAHPSAQTRSAAAEALIAVMSPGEDTVSLPGRGFVDRVMAVLSCLRHGICVNPSTATGAGNSRDVFVAQAFRSAKPSNEAASEVVTQRVLKLLTRALGNVPDALWTPVVESCVDTLFEHPSESVVVAFLSKVSQSVGLCNGLVSCDIACLGAPLCWWHVFHRSRRCR